MHFNQHLVQATVIVGLISCPGPMALADPPDSMILTEFMQNSAFVAEDLNGDCVVSDVDIALHMRTTLISLYGQQMLPGDLDDDGFVSVNDQQLALASILRQSFGHLIPNSEQVTEQDVFVAITGIATGDLSADVNLDGFTDFSDVTSVIDQMGTEVFEWHLFDMANHLYDYIDAINEYGEQAFMAAECELANEHMTGVSETWPPHAKPRGWPPNHLPTISNAREDHSISHSSAWPPNHQQGSSETWPPPPFTDHQIFVSYSSDPVHERAVSKQWPPNHTQGHSGSWNEPAPHEVNTSRTWWPEHGADDSRQRIVPPLHYDLTSTQWEHNIEASSYSWPPNHNHTVSGGWGPSHLASRSSYYPPNHVNYASGTWTQPEPWPPTHTNATSSTWPSSPSGPGSWPVFPHDHSWWTTFQESVPLVPVPRFPYGTEVGQ